MSKKKKTNLPAKYLALSEEERKMADAGRSIFAKRMGELLVAWREDFKDVLFALGDDVAKPEDLGFLGDGLEHFPAIRGRLALGLDYIVSDSELAAESGCSIISYELGIESVLSMARIILPRHFIKDWKGQVHAYDVESLRHEIDGCIIALVARGKLQHATDLIRLACCVMAIDRDKIGATTEELRTGSSNKHKDDFHKLKALLSLDACFHRGEIPTKMRLRNKFFDGMDPSNFSVVLRGMRIRDLLPDEPKARGSKTNGVHQGSSFPATIRSEDAEMLKILLSTRKSGWVPDVAGEVCDGAPGADSHLNRSAPDPAMIDRDIRVIREKLGSVYHLLLIEFGMSELEDEADLRAFVSRLSERGLRFS